MTFYQNLTCRATRHADRATGPVHITRFSDPIFLRVITKSIARQIERLENLALVGDGHAEAWACMVALTLEYEKAAGCRWSSADRVAA